jgi:hypothetical protein
MNKTANKSKRRTPLEDYLWPLFVEACGNKCVGCGQVEVALQRGHIQRHADGGALTIENLMPLCAPCNGKNNQGFSMIDTRPADWRDRFLKLQAQKLSTKPTVTRVDTGVIENGKGTHRGQTGDSLETKEIISWDALTFEHDLEIYITLPITALFPAAPNLPGAEEATVQELSRMGTKLQFAPISPPKEKCRDKMKRLVVRNGREKFIAAGKEYLRQCPWADAKGYHIDRLPWDTFVDNFTLYQDGAREYASFKAKRDAEEHARAIQYRIEEQERKDKERGDRYWNIRNVSFPNMAEDDRAFISSVPLSREDIQSVSDRDFHRLEDIWSKYRAYQRTTPKGKLLKMVETLKLRFVNQELQLPDEQVREFEQLRKQIDLGPDEGPELTEYERRLLAVSKKATRTEKQK